MCGGETRKYSDPNLDGPIVTAFHLVSSFGSAKLRRLLANWKSFHASGQFPNSRPR
jgi:hypothetical protein